MPAHPCMSTTAGNGPAPAGRSSHAGTASGLPGVAFGNERFVETQPARTSEAKSADIARRSMNRAYTAPQRGAKLERQQGRRLATTLFRMADAVMRAAIVCGTGSPTVHGAYALSA